MPSRQAASVREVAVMPAPTSAAPDAWSVPRTDRSHTGSDLRWKRVHYERGVVVDGRVPASFGVVENGVVQRILRNDGGRQVCLELTGPGGTLNESVLLGLVRPIDRGDLRTSTGAVVAWLLPSAMPVRPSSEVTFAVLAVLAARVRAAAEATSRARRQSSEQRIAQALLDLHACSDHTRDTRRHPPRGPHSPLSLLATVEDLSLLSSAHTDVVRRALRVFRRRGWISNSLRDHLHLLCETELRDHTGSHAAPGQAGPTLAQRQEALRQIVDDAISTSTPPRPTADACPRPARGTSMAGR